MAIDDADQSGSGRFDGADESASPEDEGESSGGSAPASVGGYTWADFMEEHGYGHEVSTLYPERPGGERLGLEAGPDDENDAEPDKPSGDDWNDVEFDPVPYLGFNPDELGGVFAAHDEIAEDVDRTLWEYIDPVQTPCVKGVYEWEHFKQEFYYDGRGTGVKAPQEDGETVPFEPDEHLGFEPDEVENKLFEGNSKAEELADLVEERTVNVREEMDEDEFFSTVDGHTTVVNRYDLEKAVPMEKKTHFREEERYWVNKPYAFVALFHSEKENEKKYYVVEPYLNEIEIDLQDFLTGKLRTAIKYADEEIATAGDEHVRKDVIERETKKLLQRYDLFTGSSGGGTDVVGEIKKLLGREVDDGEEEDGSLGGIEARPEPAVLEDDPESLSEYQVEKLLYLLKRDFIGYERIDGIKHDINVEDISCDGYNSPVFVYHSDYEQIITNIYHDEEELDDFVVKLAQRSGKGISKRRPQVDATLPDGSRSQLTLGREVSDHGTNYTIRQFKDVPFTPIDLVNWKTFSLDEMAFLWLCIENHKSLIFAGGTASGKTTSLNAVSLFIPSNTKIVSIEDTREVELPQRNWIASVTRPSFSDDSQGDVDEFDLLEAALRQRPDYIVMGEIRGEEGRTLFQVMSTGHTTYTTFHADSVGEVLKRFTTAPINVSKTMFTALDLVSIQTQTRVQGHKVRRNKVLTEVNHYDAENDEINVQDVYQWQAETDEFLKMGESNTLDEIKFDRGWGQERLDRELEKRRVILAYLIKNGLNEYAQVAATIQAFINDPETILTLIANGVLEESLEDLREMESVLIDVDPEKEELVPRPDPNEEGLNEVTDILERAEESILQEFKGKTPSGLASALDGVEAAAEPELDDDGGSEEFDFGGPMPEDDAFGVDGDSISFGDEEEEIEEPDWFSGESGFFFGDEEGDADASADDVAPEARDAIDNLDTDTGDDPAPKLDEETAAADAQSAETPAIEAPDDTGAETTDTAEAATDTERPETADTPAEQMASEGAPEQTTAEEPTESAAVDAPVTQDGPAEDGDAVGADAAATGTDADDTATATETERTEATTADADTAASSEEAVSPPVPDDDASSEQAPADEPAETSEAVPAAETDEAEPAIEVDDTDSAEPESPDASDATVSESAEADEAGTQPADEQPTETADTGTADTDDNTRSVFGDQPDDGGVFSDDAEPDDEGGSLFDDADDGFGGPTTDDFETDSDDPFDGAAPADSETADEGVSATEPTPDADATADTEMVQEETPEADAPDIDVPDPGGTETPSGESESVQPDADAVAAEPASDTDEETDEPEIDPASEQPEIDAEPSQSEADERQSEADASADDEDGDADDATASVFDEIDGDEDGTVFSDIDEDDEGDDGADKEIEGFEYVDFEPEDGDD
ncbi:flagellar protein FlaI [Natronoarchaeum philippinense]|uniref:Flagellar protein FlaI n=1 Tax=Natronoarchaeum philippinense TaxID=558529 RepID=A0A285NV73_NATPI|nr:flagellar protein FlaI [Natronoarchaeum philippinense]